MNKTNIRDILMKHGTEKDRMNLLRDQSDWQIENQCKNCNNQLCPGGCQEQPELDVVTKEVRI